MSSIGRCHPVFACVMDAVIAAVASVGCCPPRLLARRGAFLCPHAVVCLPSRLFSGFFAVPCLALLAHAGLSCSSGLSWFSVLSAVMSCLVLALRRADTRPVPRCSACLSRFAFIVPPLVFRRLCSIPPLIVCLPACLLSPPSSPRFFASRALSPGFLLWLVPQLRVSVHFVHHAPLSRVVSGA